MSGKSWSLHVFILSKAEWNINIENYIAYNSSIEIAVVY